MSSADLLSVSDVMKRYGLRDRRAARRLMDEVGALLVATNLYVRRGDLLAYEERLIASRSRVRAGEPSNAGRQRTRSKSKARESEALEFGWWKKAS
jgi:hypothetical protein